MRLFFAVLPAPEQNEALTLAVAPLVAELGGQPVPARNLHATLRFVGVIDPEKLDALRAAAAAVRGVRATLRFDTLECWETPKILCATATESGEMALADLSRRLAEAAIGAGFSPDDKSLRPHLTLARKVSAEAVAKHEWPQPFATPLVARFDSFALMQSRRDETGSVYSVVDSWPLYGAE